MFFFGLIRKAVFLIIYERFEVVLKLRRVDRERERKREGDTYFHMEISHNDRLKYSRKCIIWGMERGVLLPVHRVVSHIARVVVTYIAYDVIYTI